MISFLLPQASSMAPSVDRLFSFIFWTSLACFLIIVFGKLFFIIRFRRKKRPEHLTPYITGHMVMELSIAGVLLIWVMVIFYWGWKDYEKLRVSPSDAMEVYVTGRQWSWQFTYPEGQRSAELIVPKGKPVKLIMTSEDVLHSFFVPAFRVKQDLIPKVYTSLWFEATQTGTFPIYCAEYCGTAHSAMLSKVRVLEPEAFEDWQIGFQMAALALKKKGEEKDLAGIGKNVYETKQCMACHSIDGKPSVGPSLFGIFGKEESLEGGATVTVDENYIRESLLNPMAKVVKGFPPAMPSMQGQLSEEEIQAVIEFIKTLKGEKP